MWCPRVEFVSIFEITWRPNLVSQTALYQPLDPSKILLHFLIGQLSQEMDVLLFNQDFSIVAERNFQDMSATDCLEGQIKKKW